MSEQSERGLFVRGMPWNEIQYNSSIESALGMYINIVEMSSLQQQSKSIRDVRSNIRLKLSTVTNCVGITYH